MKDLLLKKVYNKKYPVFYRYIDNGADDTIVFVHGLFSSSLIFRHFFKHTDKNILLIELRGVVYSKCKKPYVDNYVEDIRLVLKEENIENNLIFVGYSLGCIIVNQFVAENDHISAKKIIMLSPVNMTIKEIGKKKVARTFANAFGKTFRKRWKEYVNLHQGWSPLRWMKLFNMKLLKSSFKNIPFTDKCEIIILNGTFDTFFNFNDSCLASPNIKHETIDELDHFIFLNTEKIKSFAQQFLFYLKDPV